MFPKVLHLKKMYKKSDVCKIGSRMNGIQIMFIRNRRY
jgi:hypothetical protein